MSATALALRSPRRWRIYADEPKGIMPWTLQDFASAHGGTYGEHPEFGPFAEFTDEYLSMHMSDKHWRIPLARIAVRVDDDSGGDEIMGAQQDEWIDLATAGAMLGVSTSYVHQLIQKRGWKRKLEGRSTGTGRGTRVALVKRSDVQALLDEGYHKTSRGGRKPNGEQATLAETAPPADAPLVTIDGSAGERPSAPPDDLPARSPLVLTGNATIDDALADLQGALDLVFESSVKLVQTVTATLAAAPTPEQARIEAVTDVLAKLRDLAMPSGNGRTAEATVSA